MTREKILLKLISEDIRALHSSALALEKDLHRLSHEIESQEIGSLAELIAQINCTGFSPIEALMRDAGIKIRASTHAEQAVALRGVLSEAGECLRRVSANRIGTANAISVMRRAARYMEMYCASIAESAARLRLTELARHLRAWAREWIGLELNLNAVAARSKAPSPAACQNSRMQTTAFAAA